MEASALTHSAPASALVGRSPLLRLQGDEKLIALIRRGHHGAFEALMQRYQPRLLAFCRHMLNSTEDAEDVLQEVFAASFNAICADDRPINARPWLYRIARNRCLNHLRRNVPAGQDSMDVFERDGGTSTADTVHKREEFRQIVADVGDLPETQRTALLLREIDALSYEQIAEAMDTTVPSVKSLLVRARVSLAEAAEARLLTCDEVRMELGQVAEGIAKTTAPVRRHLKACDRCRVFRKELRGANRALAAVYPLGPLVIFKKLFIAKLGAAAGGTAGSGATAAGGMGLAGAGGAVAAGGAGGIISAGIGTVASKTVAGLAAAAIVTAGAVEVKQVSHSTERAPAANVASAAVADPVAPAPAPAQPAAAPVADEDELAREEERAEDEEAEDDKAKEKDEAAEEKAAEEPTATVPAEEPVTTTPAPVATTPPGEDPNAVDEQEGTSTLPEEDEEPTAAQPDPVAPAPQPTDGSQQPPANQQKGTPAEPVGPASKGSSSP
ncbi:MAG: sigma-70 family RNA polymerase sigma factor [Thermoleophilaceae bacterium]